MGGGGGGGGEQTSKVKLQQWFLFLGKPGDCIYNSSNLGGGGEVAPSFLLFTTHSSKR